MSNSPNTPAADTSKSSPTSTATPPDGRVRYANGERRRAEIVEAATKLFAKQGFQRHSLRQIATALGTSHTMLRHHFGNKDALLEAVLTERERVENPQREKLVSEQGLIEALPQIMESNAHLRVLIQLDATLRTEAIGADHPAHEYTTGLSRRFLDSVQTAIEQDQTAGRMRTDIDPTLTALQITSLIEGLQTRWLYDESVDMAAAMSAFVEHLRP